MLEIITTPAKLSIAVPAYASRKLLEMSGIKQPSHERYLEDDNPDILPGRLAVIGTGVLRPKTAETTMNALAEIGMIGEDTAVSLKPLIPRQLKDSYKQPVEAARKLRDLLYTRFDDVGVQIEDAGLLDTVSKTEHVITDHADPGITGDQIIIADPWHAGPAIGSAAHYATFDHGAVVERVQTETDHGLVNTWIPHR